jgi:hypothetical protein
VRDPADVESMDEFYSEIGSLEGCLLSASETADDVCAMVDAFTVRCRVDVANAFLHDFAKGSAMWREVDLKPLMPDKKYHVVVGISANKGLPPPAASAVMKEYDPVIKKLSAVGNQALGDYHGAYLDLLKMTLVEKVYEGEDASSVLVFVPMPGPMFLRREVGLEKGLKDGNQVEFVKASANVDAKVYIAAQGQEAGKTAYLAQNLSWEVKHGAVMVHATKALSDEYVKAKEAVVRKEG